MKTSVALIGFMGTGKTVVGKSLAARLGKDFIELDAEIEKIAGKSIPAIFREDGEVAFRALEIEAVARFAGRRNTVIACGGGIVLNMINVFRLKPEYVIVCLKASVAEILRRTSRDKTGRPLLDVGDREKQVKELLEFRRPFYERAAEISLDTDGTGVPGVVQKILDALNSYESNRK